MTEGTKPVKIVGVNPSGKEVVSRKSGKDKQLELFQTVLGSGDYSNAIDLYDALPKIYPNPKRMDALRDNGKYLPVMVKEFEYNDKKFKLEIKPVRIIDKHNNEKEFYPTERELLVEEALRKIATRKQNGIYLDNEFGVEFTLYELMKELQSTGHTLNYKQIIEALTICSEANMSLESGDGENVMKSPIFPVLMLSNRSKWLEDPKSAKCYVKFNPLVNTAMQRIQYRQTAYGKYMNFTSAVTRWLHRRLSQNFTNANENNHYHVLASSIIRDSGLLSDYSRTRDAYRQIEDSWNELVTADVVHKWTKEVRKGRNNKTEDIKYLIYPTYNFIQEMKIANASVRDKTKELAAVDPEFKQYQREQKEQKDLEYLKKHKV